MLFQEMILTPSAMLAAVMALVAMVGVLALHQWFRSETHTSTVGEVSRILIYPLKSARGISLESSMCLKHGFQYDRRWVVVNTNSEVKVSGTVGTSVSMVNCPKLAQIQPQIGFHKCAVTRQRSLALNLTAENMPVIEIRQEQMTSGRLEHIHVPRVSCLAYDCGENVARWLSTFLGKPGLRLYHMAGNLEGRRPARDPKWGSVARSEDVVSFASQSPYLVCTEQSLADVSSRVGRELEMERFRPNIVVKCTSSKPYAEDAWQRFAVNNIVFRIMRRCGRCMIIQQDPMTGEKDGDDVSPLLGKMREYRLDSSDERHGRAPVFGIRVVANCEGQISVGDTVAMEELGSAALGSTPQAAGAGAGAAAAAAAAARIGSVK